MANGAFNAIAILDAIPEGELNTARSLYDELRDIADFKAAGLRIRYFRVNGPVDIETAISELRQETQNDGLRPWIHLDGHGLDDESGFVTADGTGYPWSALKELLTPLNIDTDFNLFLILATCFGGSFARAIETTDRAPLVGLVGPTREITAGDAERDFRSFYRTFFETESFKDAFGALVADQEPDLYYLTEAKRFFCAVWANYKENYCTDEKINERARKLYRDLRKKRLPRTPSIGWFKRKIRSEEKPHFEKYRDRYFMYDLNENNKERFPLTYEEAEALRQE